MNALKKGQIYENYILSVIKHSYKFCWLWNRIKLTKIKEIDEKLKLFI